MTQVVGFGLFSLAIPAGLGSLAIYIVNLLALMAALTGHWTIKALVLVLYFLALLFFFITTAIWDTVREIFSGIDHSMRRILSIFVIGFSDLLFRGATWAARLMYGASTLCLLWAGYGTTSWAFNGSDGNALHLLLADSNQLSTFSPIRLAFSGLALSYGTLFLLLPLMALTMPAWRRMTIRPKLTPVAEDKLDERVALLPQLRVAHLSDLHVSAAPSLKSDPNASALQDAGHYNADIIALTGDLTDAGTYEQWSQFLQLPHLAQKDKRIVLVPGNHDLNLWNKSLWRSALTIEPGIKTGAHARAHAYLQVAVIIMGHRTWVICPFTKGVRRLADVYRQAKSELDGWANQEKISPHLMPSQFLSNLFPMIVETTEADETRRVACVVWNTVKANRWAFFNSIGDLGIDQIERGEQLLKQEEIMGLPLLHMMHHQLAVPRAPVKTRHVGSTLAMRFETLGMGVETPETFLKFIRERSQRSCVLHGHHHKYFVCREANSKLTVVSAPSSKYGTEVSFSDHVKAGSEVTWLGLVFSLDGAHLDLRQIEPR